MAKKKAPAPYGVLTVDIDQEVFEEYLQELENHGFAYDFDLDIEELRKDPRVAEQFIKSIKESAKECVRYILENVDVYDDFEVIFEKEIKDHEKEQKRIEQEEYARHQAELKRISQSGVTFTVASEHADKAKAILIAAGLLGE